MRLTLIKPNMGRRGTKRYVDSGRMEPLQLGVLAGLTPSEVEITLVDDRSETIDYDLPTDLVALTVETFTARRAYEIAEQYRRRGVPVVMGGMHPTLIPDEVAGYCDAVITGDAEAVWSTVLDDAAAGRLQARYDGHIARPPQHHGRTRRDLFRGKGYLPITLLQYSRGCRYRCSYCATSVFFDRSHQHRPVAEVIDEIRAQKRRYLFFVDDNITADHEAAKELFAALIPLKVRWVSQASLDMLRDAELMDLMVRSGCQGNVIGFESINTDSLIGMRKAVNRAEAANQYAGAIDQLRRLGLQTWAAFTIGHDADTVESIRATCRFAIENKFTFAAYNILMPYPGTALYDDLAEQGRLLYDGQWWLHPDYRFNHAAFLPANMPPDELTRIGFACRARTNSVGSILRRLAEPRTNLRNPIRFANFVAYNPLFRREVFKKQSMALGYHEQTTPRRDDG
ncbi:B12-binding domain-containing radical SAM protein [Enemella sp. A6]|uniref:B12-binding domain-containing radical SAM protein n=1 Tax=Enemella sp. A6 TaxID=3440152 RepID=UPI003EBEE559